MESKKVTMYLELKDQIEKIQDDNYGYELSPATVKKLDKIQEKIDSLVGKMTEDDLYDLNIDPEMIKPCCN